MTKKQEEIKKLWEAMRKLQSAWGWYKEYAKKPQSEQDFLDELAVPWSFSLLEQSQNELREVACDLLDVNGQTTLSMKKVREAFKKIVDFMDTFNREFGTKKKLATDGELDAFVAQSGLLN